MLNPFTICSVEQQRVFMPFADQEVWKVKCRALGATDEQVGNWDVRVRYYAITTPYPNSTVVAYLRKLACDILERGKPWPTDIEQALDNESVQGLQQTLDRLFR